MKSKVNYKHGEGVPTSSGTSERILRETGRILEARRQQLNSVF